MLAILEQRAFPLDELRLLASQRPGQRVLRFRDADLEVQPVSPAAFAGVDLALFATSAELSRTWAPVARARALVSWTTRARFAWTRSCRWSCPR